jgi:choline dehydrogenase
MADADFIIVGAGSTGGPLAARLSEDPSINVLLIEAGGVPTGELFDVPSQWGRQLATRYDWDYMSEPEPGLGNRRTYLPRGKAVGGTSAMNAMLYVRGVRSDFDEWEARGATGWGWDELLPYFVRTEANVRGASALHGDSGPIVVSDRISQNRLADAWLESATRAGHRRNDDFNGSEQEGVGYYQLSLADGRRVSTYSAYLREALRRPNLTLVDYRLATRLVWDGLRVVGIEVEHEGRTERFTASRELIVCAGAYNTPQLLMLSGIGPGDHLRSLGIDVVADLPVGDNLQDHPGVPLVMDTDEETLFVASTPEEWARYRATGKGILSSNGVEAGGFAKTHPELADCDVQLFINPWPFLGDARTPPTVNGFTVVVELLRPKSTGTVRLRSAEPSAKPLITHNHFADPTDLIPIRNGIRRMLEILEQPPIAAMNHGPLRWPDHLDDDGLDDYIRRNALGYFHPSSTCAMGRVLDGSLKVLGVDGWRVADASAMPNTMRGNPNAACIVMGEKTADILTAEHGLARERTGEPVAAR